MVDMHERDIVATDEMIRNLRPVPLRRWASASARPGLVS